MDSIRSVLKAKAAMSTCWPLPRNPQPNQDNQQRMLDFLVLFFKSHLLLRYCFQYIEMKTPGFLTAEQADPPVSPLLQKFLGSLAKNLLNPFHASKFELIRLNIFSDPEVLVTFLALIYNAALQKPLSDRPVHNGQRTHTQQNSGAGSVGSTKSMSAKDSAKESILGWTSSARLCLPLVEAAVLLETRSLGFASAACSLGNSKVLNAISCSKGQGQIEWIGLVADTFTPAAERLDDLQWYQAVKSTSSSLFLGSESMVVNEIIMADSTIDQPNELFNMLNSFWDSQSVVDITYKARYELATIRKEHKARGSLQVSRAAAKILHHVRTAILIGDPLKRKEVYEKWVGSQWDAPSIFVLPKDIRTIIGHLDENVIPDLLGENMLQRLIVEYRGLKQVCARARALARQVIVPSRMIDDLLPLYQVQGQVLAYLASVMQQQNFMGLVMLQGRTVGTDTTKINGPRRLWDLTFNTTLEFEFTDLPWVAVSHSWAQASGDCGRCSINGRANFIPWATLEDINNVRQAVQETGHVLAWWDKICLRQRGVDGQDGALRQIEWATDIPFIDLAYRKAAKILVYLEGAGRPLRYRTTFPKARSWLHRKWTAQETPAGVPLLLGDGSTSMKGDFFTLCEDVAKSWHGLNHPSRLKEIYWDDCAKCQNVLGMLKAVQELRELPADAHTDNRIQCIWNVMKGRSAGCDADQIFSLCSLFEMEKRPKYQNWYTREQAAGLVQEELSPDMLSALNEPVDRMDPWFDGIFSTFEKSYLRAMITDFSAFSPDTGKGKGRERTVSIQIRGYFSKKVRVLEVTGETRDPVPMQEDKCACKIAGQILHLDNRDVYYDFAIWHGSGFCCAVISESFDADFDPRVFDDASHLLLSSNHAKCALLRAAEETQPNGAEEQHLTTEKIRLFSARPQWAHISKGLKVSTLFVKEAQEAAPN
jgi:hypothetical protein